MRKCSLSLAVIAVVAASLWSYPANALTFHFSFTNNTGSVPGTVTGDITGLVDNQPNQSAAGVFVTSFPAALNITLSPAFNFVTAPSVPVNSFNVSGGLITGLQFVGRTTDFITPFIELDLFSISRLFNFQPQEIDDRFVEGPLLITPVPAVPVPAVGAGLPGLLLVGAGLLHWWRRKRKQAA
jgi:hypothetical protein